MRVALLITDLQPGGTPLRVARLARGLRDRGADVQVGCLAPLGPVGETLAAEGFTTFAGDARHARDRRAVHRIVRHIRRTRPQVLHGFLTHANVVARLVGWWTRTPVVTTTATIEVERRWHVWAERTTWRLERAHVVNSPALAAHACQTFHMPCGHVHLIPPAIAAPHSRPSREEARTALGLPPHAFAVAWTGRFDPVKRVEWLMTTAEILSAWPFEFLIAGDGPHRPMIEKALRLSSARQRVRLLGWRDDLGEVLSAADAFVLPSRTEGLPNALLEALAAGLPCVTADLPALRHWAGLDAALLRIGDPSPHALAEMLQRLQADAALRQRLGTAAREWAAPFVGATAAASALCDIYHKLATHP